LHTLEDQTREGFMPDYVIVGGGSAGCAIAARLSENANSAH
jgi:choline dehydrogenase-like flavoprotein